MGVLLNDLQLNIKKLEKAVFVGITKTAFYCITKLSGFT